ncbi:low molecular weight phosphatase family protein [Microbacterium sp. RURRCA19A]|uniref:arsenate reductase/protein-tyrosine-phosphatase family protein n=1 Tax=Microbacterium sp. RURRCA19A TaxID=1907391 RepID=UPI0020C9BB64|nr:low molecular weight phosphatase family protein [Microbacterium sp. RURRCA19A]
MCTGNICRSPYAEVDLQRRLAGLDVRVVSAGTGALIGEPVPEPGLRLAAEAGIDLSGHRGRQIAEQDVRDADLILALTREHRKAIVAVSPAALRRTFTLLEFARIAEYFRNDASVLSGTHATDSDRLAHLVAFAARVRGTIPPPDNPGDLDITDPFLQSDAVYRESYGTISGAVGPIAEFLIPDPTRSGRE